MTRYNVMLTKNAYYSVEANNESEALDKAYKEAEKEFDRGICSWDDVSIDKENEEEE